MFLSSSIPAYCEFIQEILIIAALSGCYFEDIRIITLTILLLILCVRLSVKIIGPGPSKWKETLANTHSTSAALDWRNCSVVKSTF